MNKSTIVQSLAMTLVLSVPSFAEYEYYKGSQSPGTTLRGDVELREVIVEGGKPTEYVRREVKAIPRKGVDKIDVVDGMEFRMWTLTDKGKEYAPSAFTKNGKLDAHLIGFRGVGSEFNDKKNPQPEEPGVVLRLPDGTKRMFPRGSFAKQDVAFVMERFAKEMKRIRAGLDKTPRAIPERIKREFPNNAKPGEPGTMQENTPHFVWGAGSQTEKGKGGVWINDDLEQGARYRKYVKNWSENMWAVYEYSGHLMPFWDKERALKYMITVPGTVRDGYQNVPGFAGGGYGGCGIKMGWVGLLSHEWGHGSRINGMPIGGGEAGADSSAVFSMPGAKGNHHPKRPARNVFNGFNGYGMTTFWSMMGDDPNLSYGWFGALPYAEIEKNSLLTVARMLQQRKLATNGVRGLGDLVGEYAARLATTDCELQPQYRRGFYAPMRQWLEPVSIEENIWRVPADDIPEPFGMNIVRLVPKDGATTIAVDLMGMHDPKIYSDWRACIVSVQADGSRRYSNLFNKGEMKVKVKPDDASHWLTVAATPTAMYAPSTVSPHGQDLDRSLYSGRHAYKYPWQAKFVHCTPGTPQRIAGEFGGTESYQQAQQKSLKSLKANPEGGKFHANGGGWIADTATVDATAYVGPNARVLGEAKVLGNARIEDFALITGNAVVKDHAKVSGGAIISEKVVVSGDARTWLSMKGEEPASLLPTRPGAKDLHKESLWANYAMNCPDTVLLQNFYRFPDGFFAGYAKSLAPGLNGYVKGKPEFVTVDGREGFAFNAKDQYAEISPRGFDLAAGTVTVTFKLDAQRSGTIFDFGSSKGNGLTLAVSGSGKLTLTGMVEGKKALSLVSSAKIRTGQWVDVRVELDGSVASLWVNGKSVAREKSTVRPCDFYAPDAMKENTIAAARGGKDGLEATFDSVVIYHAVHEDFAALEAPTEDSPIIPTDAIVKRQEEILGDAEVLNQKISTMVDKEMEPYKAMEKEIHARMEGLLMRDEGVRKARKALDDVKKGKGDKKSIPMLEKAQAEAVEKTWKKYAPEKAALQAMAFAGWHGYYNRPYMWYMKQRARSVIGGGEMREDLKRLKKLASAAKSPELWHTDITWDWRMMEERNGSIGRMPLMKAWLIRTRGPVQREKPKGIR